MNTLDTISPADPLDHELRALDVANGVLDDVARDRKAALLASLVGQPEGAPARPADRPADRPEPGRRRRPSAWWLLPAAAAATAVALLVLPGGVAPKAYASWTPTPSPLSGADFQLATDACRARLVEAAKTMEGVPATDQPLVMPETAKTVVAERRGAYAFVSLRTDTGSTMNCLSAADTPGQVETSGGGLATKASATPKALEETQLEVSGTGMASGPEGALLSVIGRVGDDVRAVAIRSEGQVVQATVSDGYFAAWWPAASRDTSEPTVEPIVGYDVTLADGRVLTDVDPGGGRQTLPGSTQIGAVSVGGGVEGAQAVATVAGRAGVSVRSVHIEAGGTVIDAPVIDGVFKAKWNVDSVASAPASEAYRYSLTLTDGTVLTNVTPVGR